MALNVFEVFAKIGLDDSALTSGLKGAGSKIRKIAGTLGKLGAAAVTAGATMTTALVKSATSSYAEYEQLVGGVDTLFKESSAKVQAYADEAYKTAGISANEYMETVTSFSASLLQSLGGDTDKAADVANMALIDMADNANKMGTAMESIQVAYQGFAKQNYTMLDNLKLGYGGTKSEMERLLADAQEISGVEYDISNLNDVYEAIHIIQSELGITGTTALEASETISGSADSLKAAWQNLITGFANPEADFDALVEEVVASAETLFTNVMPVIERSINGISDLVIKIAPIIANKLPALASKILPNLIRTASNLIAAIVAQLPALLSALAPPFIEGILQIVQALLQPDLLANMANTITQIVGIAAQNIARALPTLIPAVAQAVVTIATTLLAPENINMLIDAAIQLIISLTDGLIEALPILIDAIPYIIEAIIQALVVNAPKLLMSAAVLIMHLANGLIAAIPDLIEMIPEIIAAIVLALIDGIPQMIQAGRDLVTGLIDGLLENNPLVEGFTEWFEDLKTFWADVLEAAQEWAFQLGETIENSIRDILGEDWVDFWEGAGGGLYDLTHPEYEESGLDRAKNATDSIVGSFVDNIGQYANQAGATASRGTTSGTSQNEATMVIDGEVFGRLVYDYNGRQSEKIGTTITER